MKRYLEESWRNDPYHDYDWDNDEFPGEFVYGDDIFVDEYYAEERWKPIAGFEKDYWISDHARVWSVKRRIFLTPKLLDDHGHLGVCLYKNKTRYYRYLHRLVAEAFIPNPNRYPMVRHLNDVPDFNEVDDIDWGTQRDNYYDSVRNRTAYMISDADREKGYAATRKPIIATNLSTREEIFFRGQTEAARILNIQQANIWKVLNGERLHAGGFTFKYHDSNRGDYR